MHECCKPCMWLQLSKPFLLTHDISGLCSSASVAGNKCRCHSLQQMDPCLWRFPLPHCTDHVVCASLKPLPQSSTRQGADLATCAPSCSLRVMQAYVLLFHPRPLNCKGWVGGCCQHRRRHILQSHSSNRRVLCILSLGGQRGLSVP